MLCWNVERLAILSSPTTSFVCWTANVKRGTLSMYPAIVCLER